MRHFQLIFLLVVTALGASDAVAAESVADSLLTLEELVVHGDSLSVVTTFGSRVLTVPPAEVDRLRRDPGANALSAAATIPGVSYYQVGLVSAGASGNPPWSFRIRGIGAVPNDGLLVLVDGRPQQVGFWGHALPDAHPLGVVERVEVHRGPASVPFGGQAFAGAVQVITRQGPATELQAAGGSFGTWNLMGRHAGPLGPVDLEISATASATDGHRGGDESDLQGGRLRLTLPLGATWRLAGLAEGTKSHFNNPGPTSAPYPDPGTGSGDIRQRTAGLDLIGEGDTWSAFVRGYDSKVHNDFYEAGNTQARDYGGRARGEAIAGAWNFKGGLDVDRNGGTFTVNGNPDFAEIEEYQLTTAPYLMASVAPARQWQLAGGLRAQFSDTYPTEWIPQAKLAFLPDERGAVTVAASRGVKNPAVAQQYLPFFAGARTVLEPESMWQYELAGDRSWGAWSGLLAVYHAEGDNLIRLEQPGFPPVYGNSGAFVHQGLDGSLVWRPGPVDVLRLGGAWMWRRDMQTLANPALSLRLDAVWELQPGLSLDAVVQAEFDRYGADGEQVPLDDLLLVNLGGGWRPGGRGPEGWEIFARVDNLLDAEWVVFDDYPMPPRAWSAGVSWRR